MDVSLRTVVPWRTPEQFKKVYKYLYSDNISRKCWAVEQIGVWQSRCWPSLPGAVEVCQMLTKALIQYLLYETKKYFCRALDIEMMFSMGIIRFVNVSVNPDQADKAKITMKELAKEYNIPPWIIDIRHDASHGLHPTLPVLRMAAESIMEYYKKVFWDPECSRIRPVAQVSNQREILVLIKKYRNIQHELIRDKYDVNFSRKLLKKVIARIEIVLCKPELRKKFFEILTHPDHCVTKEDVKLALKFDPDFADDNKNNINCSLPRALQCFWVPLIEVLHKHSYISLFLEQLQLSQGKRKTKIFQKVVDYLVMFILDMRKMKGPSCSLKKLFYKKGPIINFKRLLFCCMKGSSIYSRIVFDRILQEFPLDYWKNELGILLSIKQGLMLNKENQKPVETKLDQEISFTVEDLEEDLNFVKKSVKISHWSMPSVKMNFSLEPLGTVHRSFKDMKNKFINKKENIENKKKDLKNVPFDVISENLTEKEKENKKKKEKAQENGKNEDAQMIDVVKESSPKLCVLKGISDENKDSLN